MCFSGTGLSSDLSALLLTTAPSHDRSANSKSRTSQVSKTTRTRLGYGNGRGVTITKQILLYSTTLFLPNEALYQYIIFYVKTYIFVNFMKCIKQMINSKSINLKHNSTLFLLEFKHNKRGRLIDFFTIIYS